MAKNKNQYLFKRKGIWYFRKRVNGGWVRKALSKSVEEARRLRDDLLKELEPSGELRKPEIIVDSPLFGEIAQEWINIKCKEIKSSTLRDYRSSMNYHILPELGNRPIRELTYLEIRKFIAGMKCSDNDVVTKEGRVVKL